MVDKHRCEGLREDFEYLDKVEIFKFKERFDGGWTLHAEYFDREHGGDSIYLPIKFCPFCAKELDGS